MCNLSYINKIALNADAMSPNGIHLLHILRGHFIQFALIGDAPFLTVRIGSHLTIFSDFEKLVHFLEAQVILKVE